MGLICGFQLQSGEFWEAEFLYGILAGSGGGVETLAIWNKHELMTLAKKKRKAWKNSEYIAPYHRAGYPLCKKLLKDLEIFKPEIFDCTHSTE